MSAEPSDIAKLLALLGERDPTCNASARLLEVPGNTVLDVCHALIMQLAVEKQDLSHLNLQLLNNRLPAPITITYSGAGLLGG